MRSLIFLITLLFLPQLVFSYCTFDETWFNAYLLADVPKKLREYFTPQPTRRFYDLNNRSSDPIYLLSNEKKFYDKDDEVLYRIGPFLATNSGKVRVAKFVDGYEFVFDENKMDWVIKVRPAFDYDMVVDRNSTGITFEIPEIVGWEKLYANTRPKGKRPKNVVLPKTVNKELFLEKDGKEYTVTLSVKYALNDNYMQKSCEPCWTSACKEDIGYEKELRTLKLSRSPKSPDFSAKDQNARFDEITKFLNDNPRLAIQIEGHVPKSGNVDRDFDLGTKLAEFVEANIAERGINKERLKVISYGSEKPLIKPAKLKQNLRAEFIPLAD